jgi:hypothetical protein
MGASVSSTVLVKPRDAPGGRVEDEPAFEARGIEYIPLHGCRA